MTLGKASYPADVRAPTSMPDASAAQSQGGSGGGSGGGGGGTSGRSAMGIAPLPGAHHAYARLGQRLGRRCSYTQ
eukprot:5208732-Pleurochrysis_carterae.AAC.1